MDSAVRVGGEDGVGISAGRQETPENAHGVHGKRPGRVGISVASSLEAEMGKNVRGNGADGSKGLGTGKAILPPL